MQFKLPYPLKSNSTIGLICPAGGFDDYKPIKQVVKYLNSLGYKVKLGKTVKSIKPKKKFLNYLSGLDKDRLSDLTTFFSDKKIDAVFCLRGGYGSLRILDNIDFKLFKKNKKILLGYSDITILLLSIFSKAGLVTFHGPLLGINFLNKNLKPKNKTTAQSMWQTLKDPQFDFAYSLKKTAITVYPGKAKGNLLGGNLTDLCAMLGSKYLPDFKNSILLLEDCNEEPYKIDRLFTQLDLAGIFKKVSGVVIGTFENCNFDGNRHAVELIKDKLSKYKIPTVYKFPIGHGVKNYTVPIGMPVTLDADRLLLNT